MGVFSIHHRFLREPRHVVACLRLLVFGGLAVLGLTDPPIQPVLFWTVTIVYGLTVAGYLAANNGDFKSRRVRGVVFLFDAAVVSVLIVLRGRDVQGLVMAYFTLVLLSALLAGVGRPLVNAFVVATLYHLARVRSFVPGESFTFEHLGQLGFFFVIAAFMGYVARESRRAAAAADGEAASPPPLRESAARLRDARERLRANERLRTLDLLSMGVAHELRAPLAAIRASVEEGPALLGSLARRLEAGKDTEDLVAELHAVFQDAGHAAGKLERVAAGLSELGCGGIGSEGDVTPAAILARAEQLLRASLCEGVRLEVRCDSVRALPLQGERVLQVILNVATNALDAMDGRGGVLRLAAEDAPSSGVMFSVSDTGGGIDPEVRERMYDPFYTTKSPGRGTGLGLYVAREIVRAQSGSIACVTSSGRGTTFRIEFSSVRAVEDRAA